MSEIEDRVSKQSLIAKLVFSAFNFVSAALFIIITVLVISVWGDQLVGSENALILGLCSAIFSFFVLHLFDRSEKLAKLFQTKHVNFRWILIFLCSISYTIIGIVIYFNLADITIVFPLDEISFDIEYIPHKNFAVFAIASALGLTPSYCMYFGMKNSLPKVKIHKVKFSIFASVGLLWLVGSGIGFSYVYDNFVTIPPASIVAGNGHNDGPWLTWYNNQPETSICVSWLTAEENSSIVYYGTNPSNLNLQETGNNGNLHKVYLTGLTPDTTYYYRIPEIFEQDHISTIFNFTTAKSADAAFKFAVVGDMQPTSQRMIDNGGMVVDGLIEGDFDFVCQTGDMASSGSDHEDWHRLFMSYARLGATTPIQNAIGNHDWNGGFGAANWGALFTYPFVKPETSKYYSFDYYNAHFIMIDNFERTYSMSPGQVQWIKNDIDSAKARGQDWIFCFFHLSILSSCTANMDYSLQRLLVPIFDEKGVDAVFYGHDHAYEYYNYTYGNNGLVYDPSHTWEHKPVQYFMTGGAGGNLEIEYGVLTMSTVTRTITWYDTGLGQYRDINYERRPWSTSKYLSHPEYNPPNYTTEDRYYYHYPGSGVGQETYQDDVVQYGMVYGEQAYHYMSVEIDGNQCTISARYPNGDLLLGPGDAVPQTYTIIK